MIGLASGLGVCGALLLLVLPGACIAGGIAVKKWVSVVFMHA